MTEPGEILTVVLLVVLGSLVSVATTMRVRSKVGAHRTGESLAATRELEELLSRGGALPAVWLTAVQSMSGQAGSIDVSLRAVAPSDVPVIGRRVPSAAGSDADTVVVPETGAALVLPDGRGALLLRPQTGLGAITAPRTMLLEFGGELAVALAYAERQKSAA